MLTAPARDLGTDFESALARGVLRGLHYQLDPEPQVKLVRCVAGVGFPRFRGHRSGVHRAECRGSDEPLLIVDRTDVANR